MTRVGPATRNPTGNTVPRAIGTSPKNVPRAALPDNALDPVDELDRLDATLEHGKERPLAALVHRVLARHETDVRRRSGKPFAPGCADSRKDGDAGDVVRRHHDRRLRGRRIMPREDGSRTSACAGSGTAKTLLRRTRPRQVG